MGWGPVTTHNEATAKKEAKGKVVKPEKEGRAKPKPKAKARGDGMTVPSGNVTQETQSLTIQAAHNKSGAAPPVCLALHALGKLAT
jgi:hypothetical protein